MKIPHLIILLLPIFFTTSLQSSPSPPHFLKSTTNDTTPKQYFQLTHPLPTDDVTPSCFVSLLNHSFANTYGIPPVTVNYTPPPPTCNWTIAVLEFRAQCKGEQYDRIAGVWIDGVELLRTSTAQPTESGIFWKIRKDVNSYVETNHLSTGRAHGAYREVLVTIDGKLVGAVVPFPVIFTGGINPLFWEPVVSIGAFNLPSYDIDLTPFLGLLLDDKNHTIGIKVADGISFWLVDANLHLWFDRSDVKAQTVTSKVPSMEVQRKTEFELLDGEFEIQGERESEVTGWVYSSAGNLQTQLTEKIKFKNKLKFKDQGTKKEVDQKYKRKTKIKITNEIGQVIESLEVKIKYPLKVSIETKPGLDADTSVMTTKVEQEQSERFYGGKESLVLSHKQNCTGLMVVKGSSVLSGSAENQQNYNYNDGLGCYARVVDVVDGVVVGDDTSSICV
ncbi:putative peptide-N(4)-(N-acetyl-beta-glucosaminyl)asparagine amidase [Helianthus debilis subsp. tardiflorus]